MNKDSILGKAKEIAGTMGESLGNVLHSEKLAASGQHAQEAGRDQSAAGSAKAATSHEAAPVAVKK